MENEKKLTTVQIVMNENKEIVSLATTEDSANQMTQDQIIDLISDIAETFKPARDFKKIIPYMTDYVQGLVSETIFNMFNQSVANAESTEEVPEDDGLIK